MTRYLLSIIAACAVCSGGFALAAEGDALSFEDVQGLSALSLEQLLDLPVTTATRSEQRASEAPAQIVVVTREQMQQRGYRYLRDVFRDLPGFQASFQSAAEWGTTLFVRGLQGNHRVVFLIDGHRYNPPGGEEVPLFANLPISFIDHVEVMYGPGSALYGSDAFSGIISISTTRKNDHERVELVAEGGLSGSADIAAFGRLELLDDLNVTLGAHYNQLQPGNMYALYPNEYRYDLSGVDKGIRLDTIDARDIALDQSVTGERGYDVHMRGEWGQDFTFGTYVRGYALSSSWDLNGAAAPFVEEARHSDFQGLAYARLISRVGDIELGSTLELSHANVRPGSRAVTPVNLPNGQFRLDDYRNARSSGVRFEEKADFSVLDDTLKIALGGTVQMFDVVPLSSSTTPWDSPAFGTPPSSTITFSEWTGGADTPPTDNNGLVINAGSFFSEGESVRTFQRSRYLGTGVFAQGIWSQSKYLNVTAGLRWDYSTRFGSTVNPRLAVTSEPWAGGALKLLYGRAYLEPTPYEVSGALVSTDSIYIPNPDGIRPEVLNSFELVVSQKLGDHVLVHAGGFVNTISNLINSSAWTGEYRYQEINPGQWKQFKLLESRNTKSGMFVGSEASVQVSTSWLRSYASFSFTQGTQDLVAFRGQVVESAPPGFSQILLKAGATALVTEDITLNLSGFYQSAPGLSFSNSLHPYADDSRDFVVVDAAARYRFATSLTPNMGYVFFLRGQNVADARYKTGSGRWSVNAAGAPQPVRSVLAGIEIAFDKPAP